MFPVRMTDGTGRIAWILTDSLRHTCNISRYVDKVTSSCQCNFAGGAASNATAPSAAPAPDQASPSSPTRVDGKNNFRSLVAGSGHDKAGPSVSGRGLEAVVGKLIGSSAGAASVAGADKQGQAPHNGGDDMLQADPHTGDCQYINPTASVRIPWLCCPVVTPCTCLALRYVTLAGLSKTAAQQPAAVRNANGSRNGLGSSGSKPAGNPRNRGAGQPSQQPPAVAAVKGGAQDHSSRRGQEWTKAEQQTYFRILKERGRDVEALMAALPGR